MLLLRLVFGALAFVCNCLGLYVLKETRNMDKTDRMILMAMSATELSYIVSYATLFTINDDNETFLQVLKLACSRCFITLYYLVMGLLTVNRFARLYYNIRYQLRWPVSLTPKCLGALLVTSLLYGVTTANFVSYGKGIYSYIVLSIVLLLVMVVTYSYAVHKLKVMRRKNKVGVATSKTNINISKGMLMSGLITCSFVIFVIFPNWVFAYGEIVNTPNRFLDYTQTLWSIGFSTDACIYVMVSPTIRHVACRKFLKCFKR